MDNRLLLLGGLLLFVVVGIVALSGSDDEMPKTEPSKPRAPIDLCDPGATTQDYHHASQAERMEFVEYFTESYLGEAEPVACGELKRQLDRRGRLPISGDHVHMMQSATGKTPLWDAALNFARELGWQQK